MTSDEKYRNLAYRTRRALKLIRKHQPKNLKEAQALGIGHLQRVGAGAFRTGYRIYGTSLFIKFPVICNNPYSSDEVTDFEGKNHTRMEVKKIRRLRENKIMAGHMPPIYYFNTRDGVLVTKFYKPVLNWRMDSGKSRILGKLIKALTGVTLADVIGDNLKIDGHDRLIFVDLGY
jgi:hypothetical protein